MRIRCLLHVVEIRAAFQVMPVSMLEYAQIPDGAAMIAE